jgi:cell division septation protein DedD
MRIPSTLLPIVLVLTTAAGAQAPSDDTARSRAIRQAGTPSAAPSAAPNDSLFRRAERMVREGRGEAGRALVDTLLAGTPPGSPQHGQALYWRASLAGDAAEAERGYRRVIVEYPVSRWSGDALLNLAQLELARGDQEQALVHLHRFEREHPRHESRARASFWLARLHFDRKNGPRGCAALATARVAASPEDVELGNQIEYYGQRCIGVDTVVASAVTRPAAPAPAPAKTPTHTPTAASTAAPTSSQHPAESALDSAGGTQLGSAGYTVQVAAYDTRPAAEALIERLQARGYAARLASTARPFRVRIGRYGTRAEAVAEQQRLKAKGLDGFVTEVERPD